MTKSSQNNNIKRSLRYLSESKLMLIRNLSLSAAGILFATILTILQVGLKNNKCDSEITLNLFINLKSLSNNQCLLEISLLAASFGIPLSIILAAIYEIYIAYGKSSYMHLRSDFSINIIKIIIFPIFVSLNISIMGIIWYLSNLAFIIFLLSIFISVLLHTFFYNNFNNFLQNKHGVETKDA